MVVDILVHVICWECLEAIGIQVFVCRASLRIVFLACKNPALEFAGDGTSVNRVREGECGFCLLDDRNDFKIVVCL